MDKKWPRLPLFYWKRIAAVVVITVSIGIAGNAVPCTAITAIAIVGRISIMTAPPTQTQAAPYTADQVKGFPGTLTVTQRTTMASWMLSLRDDTDPKAVKAWNWLKQGPPSLSDLAALAAGRKAGRDDDLKVLYRGAWNHVYTQAGTASGSSGASIGITQFLGLLTSSAFWLRVGEFILGALLVAVGVSELAGREPLALKPLRNLG